MFDPVIASIIIAVIGMIGAVWAAYVSNKNQKATRDITAVLNNTKTPVDSLDQVVRLLQEELTRTNTRHDREREYFNQEIVRVRAEHRLDQEEWEKERFKMQSEIDKLIAERKIYLDKILDLETQLAELKVNVEKSMESVREIKKK